VQAGENLAKATPKPVWEGTSLKFESEDGRIATEPVDLKGEQGAQGPEGPAGEKGDKGDPGEVQIATTETVGVVKPDGKTLGVDADGVLAVIGGISGSSTSTIPTITGNDSVPAGYATSYTLSSTSGLTGGEILSFDVTFNGETWNVAASGGKAVVSITIPEGTAEGETFTITAVANDNFGGTSKPGSKTIASLGAVSIAPAVISSPAQGEQHVSIRPSIRVSPMQVIGGVEDTARHLQVQIATDAAFTNVVFDTGAAAPPSDLVVSVSTALALETRYYVRARWTGQTYGTGSYGTVVQFTTVARGVLILAMGAVLAIRWRSFTKDEDVAEIDRNVQVEKNMAGVFRQMNRINLMRGIRAKFKK